MLIMFAYVDVHVNTEKPVAVWRCLDCKALDSELLHICELEIGCLHLRGIVHHTNW